MPEIMTVEELADLLRVSRWVVYKAVQRRGLPAVRGVSRRMLFRRESVTKWLTEKEG